MSHRDPIYVLHSVLLASKGGLAAAAKAIGRSPGVLYNKFAESVPQYEVTAREAIALADHLSTKVYAEAIAEHFGGVFLDLPAAAASDDDILQAYLGIIQQMGELSKEFTEARADGVIELSEFNAIRLRAHRTVAAIMVMVADLEGMVRELPGAAPASLSVVGK